MSALLIDEKIANDRLNHPGNLASRWNSGSPTVIHIDRAAPKGPFGNGRIPDFLKVAIAVEARSTDRPQRQIAQDHGVTQQTVSNLAIGKPSAIKGIEDKIDDQMNLIKDTAMSRLMSTLGLINDEKLGKTNAIGLSNIARNLASIVERVSPDVDANKGVTQLIVYCPAPRKEELYEVVDV